MRAKLKKVYYCDFCKKHSLRPLTKHEEYCTANPNRKCRLCEEDCQLPPGGIKEVIKKIEAEGIKIDSTQEEKERIVKKIRDEVGSCPACMLTVIRCSGLNGTFLEFDYEKEMEEWWKMVNEDSYPAY